MTTHKPTETTATAQILTDEALEAAQGGFFAFNPGFTGGVSVATGDVKNEGGTDNATGTGPGGKLHVRVIDGATGGL